MSIPAEVIMVLMEHPEIDKVHVYRDKWAMLDVVPPQKGLRFTYHRDLINSEWDFVKPTRAKVDMRRPFGFGPKWICFSRGTQVKSDVDV